MQSIQLTDFDLDALRTQLRKMSDKELQRFGNAARHMTSSTANMGKPPLPAFLLQLQEARAEWRKRHPPKVLPDSSIVSPNTHVTYQALGAILRYRDGHCQGGRLIRFAPTIFVSPKVFFKMIEWHSGCSFNAAISSGACVTMMT